MRPIHENVRYQGEDTSHFVAGVVSFLVVVAVVFGLVVLLTKYAQKQAGSAVEKAADPIDIIKARYAKGEINKEEFEQLKKDLK